MALLCFSVFWRQQSFGRWQILGHVFEPRLPGGRGKRGKADLHCSSVLYNNIYQGALNVRMFLRSRNWKALKKMVDKPVLNCHPTIVPLWIRDSENQDKFLPRIAEFWVSLILYQNVACCTTFYDTHLWKWVWMKTHLHIQGWVTTVIFENEAKDKSAIAFCLMSLSWSLIRKGQNNWTLLLNLAQLTNVPHLKGLTFSALPLSPYFRGRRPFSSCTNLWGLVYLSCYLAPR